MLEWITIVLPFLWMTMAGWILSNCYYYDKSRRRELRRVLLRMETALALGLYDRSEIRRWIDRLDVISRHRRLYWFRYTEFFDVSPLRRYEEIRDAGTRAVNETED